MAGVSGRVGAALSRSSCLGVARRPGEGSVRKLLPSGSSTSITSAKSSSPSSLPRFFFFFSSRRLDAHSRSSERPPRSRRFAAASSSASAISAALDQRFAGVVATAFAQIARTSSGTSSSSGSSPSPKRIAIASGPESGLSPATSAWRTHPSEKTSLRASTRPPLACSGDMYESFPFVTPSCVFSRRSCAKAMPKSLSFTSPSQLTSTFEGLTSRCTMPSGAPSSPVASCACSSACATSAHTWRATATGIGAPLDAPRRASVPASRPSTSSRTWKGWPSTTP